MIKKKSINKKIELLLNVSTLKTKRKNKYFYFTIYSILIFNNISTLLKKKNMPFPVPKIKFFWILLFLVEKISSQLREYEIYESNNNFPRPVLLNNNDVLATSGQNGGYMIKYNSKGEIILPRRKLFDYDPNAAIKQLYGSTNRYVIAAGAHTYFSLQIFDEDGNVYTTNTQDYTDSYKIFIEVLNETHILVGWCNYKYDKKVRVAKYSLSGNTFTKEIAAEWFSDNYYISCAEMDSNNAIICQYVKSGCEEYLKILTDSLVEKKSISIYKKNQCGFDKILKIGSNRVAATYLFAQDFFIKTYTYSDYDAKVLMEHTQIMGNCEVNTLKVDSAYFSETKIIGTCIHYTTKYAQISVVDFINDFKAITSRVVQCSGPNADYPFASRFGGTFLSVFYNTGGNNVYQIMDIPNCLGFELDVHINSNTTFIIEENKYLVKGAGDTSNILRITYPQLPEKGLITIIDSNSQLKSNNVFYNLENLNYFAPSETGTFILKFSGVNSDGKTGKWCSLSFKVDTCYVGCYSCSVIGDEKDNKCEGGCQPTYYPVKDIEGSCVQEKAHYYLNTTEGIFKPCYDTCDTCSKDYLVDAHNCDLCLPNFYKIEGDLNNNCYDTRPDGYYFDSSSNLFKKCYDTCSSCLTRGTADNNQCITCKKNNYMFEEIEGKCDKTDTSPNGNYYLNDFELGNIQWKKCYKSCGSCLEGGDDLNNNCKTCATGYLRKYPTKQCLNTLPDYHYEDKLNKVYRPCDISCKTCNGDPLPFLLSTNCIDCRTDLDYYPYFDDPSNCTNVQPEGYYLDTDKATGNKRYKKCYDKCKTCSKEGDETNNNCDSCIPDYYPKNGEDNSCVKDPDGYYLDIINQKYKKCYPSCQSCLAGGDSNKHNCQTCVLGAIADPQIDNTKNCLLSCTDNKKFYNNQCIYCQSEMAVVGNTCVNCKESGENKIENGIICDINGCPENLCVASVPDNYYLVNDNFNYYKKCDTNCKTCVDDSKKCLSCFDEFPILYNSQCLNKCPIINGKQLYKLPDNTCIEECPNYLVKDDTLFECKSCYPEYKYINENKCTSENDLPFGYHVLDSIYNSFDICHHNCEECSDISNNDNEQKCTKCKENLFLEPLPSSNCISSCGSTLITDIIQRKCINCKYDNFPPQYKEKNNNEFCYSSLPTNSLITEIPTNTFEYCYDKCASCKEISSDINDQKCIQCKTNTYKIFGTDNCVDDCGDYLSLDADINQCINCKTYKGQFKYIDEDSCTTSNAHSYLIDNDSNTIGKCHQNCDTCEKGPENNVQNCKTCLDTYYLQEDLINCEKSCPNYLYADSNKKECINCKEKKDVNGNSLYKYSSHQSCEALPENAFIKDEKYNLFDYCDVSCKTCSEKYKCDTCAVGYMWHPVEGRKCVKKCDLSITNWYLDDNGEYKCTTDKTCSQIGDRNYLEESNQQCVKNCDSDFTISSCVECSKYQTYTHKMKCVKTCPAGYKADNLTKSCVKSDDSGTEDSKEDDKDDNNKIIKIDNERCKVKIAPNTQNNVSLLLQTSEHFIEDYSNSYPFSSNNNIDIMVNQNYTVHLFKNDECEFETSKNNSLSYINLTNCINKILDNDPSITREDILVSKIDVNKTSLSSHTNKVAFNIYNIKTKDKIDISICAKVTISYPLSNKIRLTEAEKLFTQGIDVFNSSDPFFFDFCYPYYNDEGKDVTLEDRRNDYFQNGAFCESECNYVKVNFKTGMAECSCNSEDSSIDKVKQITDNIPLDGFDKIANTKSLMVVRCYNLVFNINYFKANIGGWLIIIFLLVQVLCIALFMTMGLKPLYSFLNKVSTQKEIECIDEKEQKPTDGRNSISISCRDGTTPNPPSKISNSGTNNSRNEEGEIEQFDTPNAFIRKVGTNAKLTILDLNKKNNFIESHQDTEEIKVRTKMNSSLNFIKTNESSSKRCMYSNLRKQSNETVCGTSVKKGENQTKEENELEDEDLDELVFDDAINYDTRGVCTFFMHCLRNKIVFLAPFSSSSVYEPFFVKLIAFFLNLATYLVFNALLFDEEYVQRRYKEKGNTGFIYLLKNEIPRCIYASLASSVVGLLITYLSYSRKRFKTAIEVEKDPKEFIKATKEIISKLKLKIICFFIINLILMLLFWYYVSAFCAVYRKTQVPWLQGCLITFIFSIIIQCFYSMIITLLRYLGIKGKISCCYTISTYML